MSLSENKPGRSTTNGRPVARLNHSCKCEKCMYFRSKLLKLRYSTRLPLNILCIYFRTTSLFILYINLNILQFNKQTPLYYNLNLWKLLKLIFTYGILTKLYTLASVLNKFFKRNLIYYVECNKNILKVHIRYIYCRKYIIVTLRWSVPQIRYSY